MKFTATAVLAFVAAANAADSSAADLNAIAAMIPSNLLAIMTYLPSDIIQDAMANGKLPTDIASVLSRATGIPTEMVPSLSSEYAQLLAQMGGGEALATPTASATTSGATSAAATSGTNAASHKSSDLGSLDQEESASGSAAHSGSSGAAKSSAKESSSNGAAKVAGSLAAAALAAVAFF
ncbi:hypothetical protein FBU59_003218 [Linderina macrospora]|uniref:Uncharacterized protein n=1 Tax=Linderina macrospora TaxID=4868 RepID=A0ACC1J8X3_9FUNG|nr:hypothetical protein FBU59_003218 [Linderina macrospora]